MKRMAGVHDFMKSAALQQFDVLKQEIVSNKVGGRRSSLRRMSLRTYSTTGFIALRQLDVENLLTKSNNTITSKRFYAQSAEGSEYNAVGWILHEGVTNCMFCGTYFGTMQKKHNCSACGLVSCGNCASNYVFIAELNDQRKHRVCNNCHGDSVRRFYNLFALLFNLFFNKSRIRYLLWKSSAAHPGAVSLSITLQGRQRHPHPTVTKPAAS